MPRLRSHSELAKHLKSLANINFGRMGSDGQRVVNIGNTSFTVILLALLVLPNGCVISNYLLFFHLRAQHIRVETHRGHGNKPHFHGV